VKNVKPTGISGKFVNQHATLGTNKERESSGVAFRRFAFAASLMHDSVRARNSRRNRLTTDYLATYYINCSAKKQLFSGIVFALLHTYVRTSMHAFI
jgi:hypothetical protein